jgi:hypothetical protein
MAMNIFFLLNALGAVFLLYVLANFWKETNRTKNDARPCELDFMREDKQAVLVMTHLIARGTTGGRSVIPLEVRQRDLAGKQDRRDRAGTIYELQIKQSSVS